MYVLPFAVYFCLILSFRDDTQLVGVRRVWCLLLAPSQSLCPFPAFSSRVCLVRNRLGLSTARQCSLGEAGKTLLICVIQGREYLWQPWPGDNSCFLFPVSEEAYLFRGTLRRMCCVSHWDSGCLSQPGACGPPGFLLTAHR